MFRKCSLQEQKKKILQKYSLENDPAFLEVCNSFSGNFKGTLTKGQGNDIYQFQFI